MITFDENTNMKGVKKGDFLLVDNVLRCKVMISYESDEVYGEREFSWSDCAIPLGLISYYSMYVDDRGMVQKGKLIVSLDDGKDVIIKGSMDDLTDLYNAYVKKDRVFKFN